MKVQNKEINMSFYPVLCIKNNGYPASLENGKIYKIIIDIDSYNIGYFRVIDETGEDYLYNIERFFPASFALKKGNKCQQ
jgi:hypothetical protein